MGQTNIFFVFLLFLLPLLYNLIIIRIAEPRDLTPPAPIRDVRNGKETLKSFKSFEDDLNWVTRNHRETHGILSQHVTSGAFLIKKENADEFCENYFSFIKNKESREILIESFKRLFYTEGHVFTHNYIDLAYDTNKIIGGSFFNFFERLKGLFFTHKHIDLTYEMATTDEITGGYFFMYAEGSSEKRKVFISLTQLSKEPVRGYYFLKDYYEGHENRVENALKYMMYKDVNSKGLLN